MANIKEIAGVFGVTERRVRQLVAENKIPAPNRGRYDLAGCARAYIEFLKSSLEVERTRLAKEQADKLEMENEEKRGRLVDSDKVGAWWASIITNAKQRFLGLPTKAAPNVLGAKTLAQVKDILEKLIYEILSELSAINPIPGAGKAHRKLVSKRKKKT